MMAGERKTMVQVTDIRRTFDISPPLLDRLIGGGGRRLLTAVDGVSFTIVQGEVFGLVGESGCGKSTVARLLAGLYRPTAGSITVAGIDTVHADRRARRFARAQVQMVFQDPYTSLNPRWRVVRIIAEPIRAYRLLAGRAAIATRVAELLGQVGLSPADGEKYPHEFSGGQRQRISIARALAGEPRFLICDEPTSALDVSVQAQLLNLFRDLQRRYGLTVLLISHNLAVVYFLCDRVGVMYLGRLCEVAETRALFARPRHPYTRMLIDTLPDIDMTGRPRRSLGGEVPSPVNPPSGCAFHPRCPYASERCQLERPELRPKDEALVACHAVEEGLLGDT
jgi:peptide/nickel transport system ATP-binding protein